MMTEPRLISIRSVTVAPPGKVLIAADLAQAESWIVAYLANEPNMKHALHNGDIHTETAGSAIFYPYTGCAHVWRKGKQECENCGNTINKTQRYIGKRYNHASSYRMSYIRAAEVINKDGDKPPYVTVTLAESKIYSTEWHKFYNVKGWWSDIESTLNATRRLTTPYGRSRVFYANWGDELFKEATAYVPQSTVADHFDGAIHPELGISGGLLEIYKQLVIPYPENKIIGQAHDSLLMEVPTQTHEEILERVKALLLRPLVINGEEFTIPVDAEVGDRWGELKDA